MADNQITTSFAAAVYKPDTGDRMALLKFVEKQKALNTRVGGVLQEAIYNSDGEIIGLDAIDVSTGKRIPISRPVPNASECGLDVSALADTTGIIRQAISERVDLIVVEKFGELEQKGKGLIDEILQTIVEGIPLLISVPKRLCRSGRNAAVSSAVFCLSMKRLSRNGGGALVRNSVAIFC